MNNRNKNDMSSMCADDTITYQKAKELYYNLDKYDEAFAVIKNEAENGNPEAQYLLGEMYYFGYGTPMDESKAVEWYNRSAENGCPDAQYQLGYLYENGIEVTEDITAASEWYKKALDGYSDAASNGDVKSLYELARMYYVGAGVESDYKKAFDLYHTVAEKGYADAKYKLGEMYKYGNGVDQDFSKSEYWYVAAAVDFQKEAENGNLKRQCELADMYMVSDNDNGLEQDVYKAFELYNDAAEKGYVHALYELGCMYEYGSGFGFTEDKQKAYDYYRHAAEQDDVDAQLTLCWRIWFDITSGDKVKCDCEEMLKWALKGAGHNNDSCQLLLGCMYQSGIGVKKDVTTARKWFYKATVRGDVDAQYDLGEMYYYGDGVEQDHAEAARWYKKAADNYDFRAMVNLGDMYEYGDGVELDIRQAFYWYDRASVEIVDIERKLIELWPLELDPEY